MNLYYSAREKIRILLQPAVLDGRNYLAPENLLAWGLEYIGIGRRSPALLLLLK